MNSSQRQSYLIGRSRDAGVVVNADGVADSHCDLSCDEQGTWSVTPRDGRVGFQDAGGEIRWFDQRRHVSPSDVLWLTTQVRLPWPSDRDALAVLTVGRASDCDIVLENSLVSGRHASLVVGPNATWVLRDNDSRNGMFIDAGLKHRVAAVMLRPGHEIYLGSQRFETNGLVAKAKLVCSQSTSKSSSPNSREPKPALVDIKPAPKPPTKSRVITIASVLIPSVITLAFWWFFMRPDSEPVANADTDTQASAAPIIDPSPALAPVSTPPTSPAQVAPSEVVEQEDPSQSIYWILLRHNDTGNFFRLGSGVAVSANTVLTTASIVATIADMSQSGYSQPTLVQVVTGKQFIVATSQQFPEFMKRSQAAAKLVADYESLVAAIGDDAVKAAQSKDELHKQAELVNVAMAATAAVDVGWLGAIELPQWLGVDASFEYRPAQSINGLGAGFDAQDPYFDSASTTQPASLDLRVKSVAAEIGGFQGVVTLQASIGDHNILGSPLIHRDKITGMIVYQDSEMGTVEIVTAKILTPNYSPRTILSRRRVVWRRVV